MASLAPGRVTLQSPGTAMMGDGLVPCRSCGMARLPLVDCATCAVFANQPSRS